MDTTPPRWTTSPLKAGVTKPLVYAYFGSKEGLYVAYIEQSGRELLDRIRGAADPGAPPNERLMAGILQFLGFVEERRDGWLVLHSEAATRGGPLADELASVRAAIARMIRRLLVQTIPDVRVTRETTAALDSVAHAVVGAGESLANWWLAHPTSRPSEPRSCWWRSGEPESTRPWLRRLAAVGLHREIEGGHGLRPQPVERRTGRHESQRAVSSSRLATGTLACPACDARVLPGPGAMSPADPISCGFCRHVAAVRDFLSLAEPTRPARVAVRVR